MFTFCSRLSKHFQGGCWYEVYRHEYTHAHCLIFLIRQRYSFLHFLIFVYLFIYFPFHSTYLRGPLGWNQSNITQSLCILFFKSLKKPIPNSSMLGNKRLKRLWTCSNIWFKLWDPHSNWEDTLLSFKIMGWTSVFRGGQCTHMLPPFGLTSDFWMLWSLH